MTDKKVGYGLCLGCRRDNVELHTRDGLTRCKECLDHYDAYYTPFFEKLVASIKSKNEGAKK